MTPERKEWLIDRAIRKVKRAVDVGDLPILDGSIQCTDCNAPAEMYEHRDYQKPLDVEPVCRTCNSRRGQGAPFIDGWHQRAWDSIDGIRETYDPNYCRLTADVPVDLLDFEPAYDDPSVRAAMQELGSINNLSHRQYRSRQQAMVRHVDGYVIGYRKRSKWNHGDPYSYWDTDFVTPYSVYNERAVAAKRSAA